MHPCVRELRRPLRSPVKHSVIVLAAVWAGSALFAAHAEEMCWARGSGQFFDGIKYCVSSVRPKTAETTYGPEHLVSEVNSGKGWCAGSRTGVGETITIRTYNGSPWTSILISNGIGATEKKPVQATRIKDVEISTDAGITTKVTLADITLLQSVALPVMAKHSSATLKILDIYQGQGNASACLSYLTPDFEEMDREVVSPMKP